MADNNASRFEPVNKVITDDIKLELRMQEHYLTGELERSFKTTITQNGDVIELGAEALEYLKDLEEGIPASKIVINERTLDEMTEYVRKRMGYEGSKAAQVAYLILRKQKIEGNPTENSKIYSRTGERTGAVTGTFKNNDTTYGTLIDEETASILDAEFLKVKSGEF